MQKKWERCNRRASVDLRGGGGRNTRHEKDLHYRKLSHLSKKRKKKKMLRGLFEGRNEGAIGSGGLWGLWGRSHSEAAAWCDGLRPVKAPGSVLRSCEEWWTAKVHQDFVLPHTCWPRACIHDKGTLLMRNDLMWTPQGGKKQCFSFWFGFSSPRVLVHTESSPWAQSGFA